MAQHGGRRTPSNPAPVSGPGSLSRRTDGGPAQKLRDVTGLAYGQNKALNDEQAAAPLAQTPGPSTPPRARQATPAQPMLTPFGAPTMRPDEPVTAGSPMGPGPGPAQIGLTDPAAAGYQSALSTLQQAAAASGGTEISALLNQLAARN